MFAKRGFLQGNKCHSSRCKVPVPSSCKALNIELSTAYVNTIHVTFNEMENKLINKSINQLFRGWGRYVALTLARQQSPAFPPARLLSCRYHVKSSLFTGAPCCQNRPDATLSTILYKGSWCWIPIIRMSCPSVSAIAC